MSSESMNARCLEQVDGILTKETTITIVTNETTITIVITLVAICGLMMPVIDVRGAFPIS
jgi:hypothetical protein